MTSDNVKAFGYAVAIAGAVFVGVKIYKKFAALSDTVGSNADKFGRALTETKEEMAQTFTKITNNTRNFISDAGRTVGLDTGTRKVLDSDGNVISEYVVEVPYSKWPESVKNEIANISRLKGRPISKPYYQASFSGWKYYSNGTITSPLNEYYHSEDEKYGADTNSVSAVWWNGDTSGDWITNGFPKVGDNFELPAIM